MIAVAVLVLTALCVGFLLREVFKPERRLRTLAKQLGGAMLVLILLAVAGCSKEYPQFFDIAWDEEVKLHDGRMIVVHIKRTYERRGGQQHEQYPAYPRLTSMTFSFERKKGQIFEHTFNRGTLYFLDEKNGIWYIGYNADKGDASVDIGNTDIFPHVALLNLDGSISKPKDWTEIPSEIKDVNILPATPNPKVISKFQGRYLSHAEKMAHFEANPTGAGYKTITRITPTKSSK